MGNTEPAENDDLDDYFASDSLERSSTVKAVTKSHQTAISTNGRTAELALRSRESGQPHLTYRPGG